MFFFFSRISTPPWAFSTCIYPLLQSTAMLMNHPLSARVTFNIMEHLEAFVTKQRYNNPLSLNFKHFAETVQVRVHLKCLMDKAWMSTRSHYNNT
ncbi:hypothetical protein EXN66_Car008768 [Channa argus]|uniref:Uncharacterized protein n=1 Tax=Channa argus TaxID=215402 RepID=A0A6G1PS46_CHAAH|nr:hypothetical protein EXN66_Car008768 [Channa argus]